MKNIVLTLFTVCLMLFSFNTLAGEPLRNLDPGVTQPNSHAFGKSLDGWMEAYIRWLEDGADPTDRVKNVAFLPILGESPFEVEVEPGTALVLPIATWIGFAEDPVLPDDWWGHSDHIFGNVFLDGQQIAVPNVDYYVGPTYLDPPASLFGLEVLFYQALVVVINPLSAGEHQVVLHSEFVDFGAAFDNTWNINVTPQKQK